MDYHAGEEGFATIELDTDFKKIREMFTGAELPVVIKGVKKFCETRNAELVKKLRYEGEIDFEGVHITKEFCSVRLVPIA